MTLHALFTDGDGWLGSDRLVFAADELVALADARHAAAALAALVRTRGEAIERAGREGYEAGRAEGRAAGEAELAGVLAERLATLQSVHDDEVARVRDACVELAAEIVRRVAGAAAPELWQRALAARAAEELVERVPLTLRVHESRATALRERLIERDVPGLVDVLGDDALAPDACVLETRAGTVDIDLETQLERILVLAAGGSADGGEA